MKPSRPASFSLDSGDRLGDNRVVRGSVRLHFLSNRSTYLSRRVEERSRCPCTLRNPRCSAINQSLATPLPSSNCWW